MFRKILFLISVLFSISIASTTKIEVNAQSITSKDDIVYANGGVEVFYQDSIIKAKHAKYDRKKSTLILDGRVELIGYKGTKEQASKIVIDTNSSDIEFHKLFMVSDNDIWITTDKATKKGDTYTIGTSILSSCDVKNPIWKMSFDKSKYYKDKEYIKLYNTTVYFLDTPIFYTPYLAFSTNNQRSSGLLFPLFGYSQDEGVLYEQPIFWAIAPDMDIEFNPQIRTKRSYGSYATFRFVDTPYSHGAFRIGYFKDNDSYAKEHVGNNDSHYGIELQYDSSKIFSKYLNDEYKDGLYINSIYLNDIDYLNLQKTSFGDFGQTPLQESKINYYLQNNDYYVGINAKYFIDTRKDVNKSETLQILPSIAIHKYLSSIFFDNLTYNIDMHIDNYYRKKGVNLKEVSFLIPVEYTFSFFDDYLNISLGEDIYYKKLFFNKSDCLYDRFRYFSTLHKIKMYSDLTKKYDVFTHVLQPSLEYLKPGLEDEYPVSVDEFNENQQKLFNVGLPEEHYTFSIGNYFYDNNMDLIFYQRLSQTYYAKKSILRSYRFGDLKNELKYKINKWEIYNELIYSHNYSKIRESSTHISYLDTSYSFSLWHTYRDILGDENSDNLIEANEISFDFNYIYNHAWQFSGALSYNLDESSSKQWKLGAKYHQDCWGVSLEVKQEIIPRPDGSDTQNSFYIMMDFAPFATLGASL